MSRRYRSKRRVKRRALTMPRFRGHGIASVCLQAGWILSGVAVFTIRREPGLLLMALLVVPAFLYAGLCHIAAVKAEAVENKIRSRLDGFQLRVFTLMGLMFSFIIFYALLLHPVALWFFRHSGHGDIAAGFGTFMINFVIVQAIIAAFRRPDIIARLKAFLF